jgi:hypothetical protein
VEILPTRNFEAVVEAAVGLAREGKLGKNGMPRNPFIMAGMGRLAECYLPGIPIWIQKPMLVIGSSIGQALGYDPAFRTYRAEATTSAATETATRGVA